MSAGTVRTHTRRTGDGGWTTVHRHSRSGRRGERAKRGAARRGWRNLGKAWRYGRRHKKGMAAAFGILGVTQIAAWVTLQGVMLTAATVAVVAAGVATVAFAVASGGRMPS